MRRYERGELRAHCVLPCPADLERRVRSGEAKLRRPPELDRLGADTLAQQRFAGLLCKRVQHGLGLGCGPGVERDLHRAPPHATCARTTDAPGGEHAGERREHDLAAAERLGDGAGMLTRGAAEAQQRELRRVVSLAQRELAHGIAHPRHGDVDEARRQHLDVLLTATVGRDLGGDDLQAPPRGVDVERRIAALAEDSRKPVRVDPPEHEVAVGDGGRATPPVAGGAGIGPGGVGTDLQTTVGVAHDRAASGSDRVDVHHRRLQPYAVDLAEVATRQLARVEAQVRRCATHVEADDPVASSTRLDHADHAARGSRQQGVDAAKAGGVRQPAVALHELDPRAGKPGCEIALESLDVSEQHGGQVRIGNGRVAPRD